ncbi:unnamed protein product [Trichogramma brassicae]|uniref:Uncharacterized protein n=1 Tax=Trichogramma brassicae TaxID=86971 RepID=A0A6H5IB08_9HYME|nr:unnamed protein product [Trichogramma brassicae]
MFFSKMRDLLRETNTSAVTITAKFTCHGSGVFKSNQCSAKSFTRTKACRLGPTRILRSRGVPRRPRRHPLVTVSLRYRRYRSVARSRITAGFEACALGGKNEAGEIGATIRQRVDGVRREISIIVKSISFEKYVVFLVSDDPFRRCKDVDDLAMMFFKVNEEFDRQVLLEVRDNSGNTPLLSALKYGKKKLAESLLRRGANPTVVNAKGETPLHIICQRCKDVDDLAMMFFKVNEEFDRQVLLEVRDNSGNTPLLSALKYGKKKLAESLLRRGANPTVVNAKGETPLHTICQRAYSHNLT